MKKAIMITTLLLASAVIVPSEAKETEHVNNMENLALHNWQHGAVECKQSTSPALEVFQYDQSSYILRQNKCTSYEAPFIYVLIGDKSVLVLDSGAESNTHEIPLKSTVASLIAKQPALANSQERNILIMHSHGHADHFAGDKQFKGDANVTIVSTQKDEFHHYFGFSNWPENTIDIDLGNRKVTVIPTPGHQEEAISLYDDHTNWLLTGDTVYPGAIYVKEWKTYKKSIERLTNFTQNNEVSFILGTHIEMKKTAGEYYPIGTTYQPNEASLTLLPSDLVALDTALSISDSVQTIIQDNLVVIPMGGVQKTLSNIVRWFTQ